MSDSSMLSCWVLHLAFGVVELQASLGSLRFDILVLEFRKYKHTLRILLYQEEMILRSGLDYCKVALLQLNCRNKSGIIRHSRVFKNCK